MKIARCHSCGIRRVTYVITGGAGRRAIRAHPEPGGKTGTECAGSRTPVHPHALTDL